MASKLFRTFLSKQSNQSKLCIGFAAGISTYTMMNQKQKMAYTESASNLVFSWGSNKFGQLGLGTM